MFESSTKALTTFCTRLIVIVTLPFMSTAANADVKGDLTATFNALNMDANVTGPKAYRDQTGGYYTGGSIYSRSPVKNTDIANVQLPSFNAGCGGIDIFTGGLSFISADELVQNLKAAVPAAAGYAFAMAMQTFTPQLYNVMTELQDWAQKINSLNINSCETAALAVGGLWPKSDNASKYMCNTLGTQNGAVSDWVKGRHECGDEDKRKKVNQRKTEDFEDQLGEEYNLVWKAIKKNKFLATDEKLAEFFMSISGSIIKEKDKKIPRNLPSLAVQNELIMMIVNGQSGSASGGRKIESAKVYSCDDKAADKCIFPTEQSFVIQKKDSLTEKVSVILEGMSDKIRNDGKATNVEMGLVNSTSIPIMKILSIEAAYKRGNAPISVSEFTESIAYDLLLKYLDTILDFVSVSLKELQKVQIESETIDQFKTEIRDARAKILEKRNGIFQQMVTTLDAIEKTTKHEKELQNMFSESSNLSGDKW